MLARLQRGLVLGALLLAAMWWLASGALGLALGWRLAGLLPILMPHAVVLALEFALLKWFGASAAPPLLRPTGAHPAELSPAAAVGPPAAAALPPPPPPAATARQLLLAWAGEVLSGLRVFAWRQPFRAHAEPDHIDGGGRSGDPARAHQGRRGVLLLHGFVCNRGLWTPWMRRLRRQGVPFIAPNLEPVFGSIDEQVPLIEAAVERLQQATGLAPVIVAHSMGGLAARAWLCQHAAAARVHRVITVGTPHHGTWLARFAVTPNGRQMQCGSAWLAQLAADEVAGAGRNELAPAARDEVAPAASRAANQHAHFICFYGHCDNIVFPTATAALPGADNRHLAGVAHVDMVNHPQVFATVVDSLHG